MKTKPQSSSRRKFPPYAKAALTSLKSHPGPLTAADLRIFTGRDAWKRAAQRAEWLPTKPTICLPPNEDPTAYRWEQVQGVEPWIITTGGVADSDLRRLALELLSAGAQVVRVSFWDGSNRSMAVFRREVANG